MDLEMNDFTPNNFAMGGVDYLDARDGNGEHMRYVLRHNPLYASNWTRVGLVHPSKFSFLARGRGFSFSVGSNELFLSSCPMPQAQPTMFFFLFFYFFFVQAQRRM